MASAAHIDIKHRLFLALRLPAEAQARVVGLQRDLSLARPVQKERLHITLLSLPLYDALPEGLAEETAEAAASVRMAPFRVAFDRAHGNGSNAVLRPSEPLKALAMFRERIGFTLMRAGIELGSSKRFSPHITLSYQCPGKFSVPLNGDSLSWLAEDFMLIHSFVGLTRHVELGRWRLG